MFHFAPQLSDSTITLAREHRGTEDIARDGLWEFRHMAPSMLKRTFVEMVFVPWLSQYTGRLIRSAKEEERRAILAALPNEPEGADDPQFHRGHNTAVKQVRSVILSRSGQT